MGLIRASIVTGIVYALWKFLDRRWLSEMECATRVRFSPWVPIVVIFLIELLI